MADQSNTPPFIAWGLYRERIGKTLAMEWRELGPVFTLADGSGGYGHFKSLPSAGWNNRFTFRPYGAGPPPLPVLRKTAPQRQQPTGELDEDEANSLFADEQE